MQQSVYRIDYKTIFGSYVMNLYKKEKDRRTSEQKKVAQRHEKELFQMIDDYVEQA